MEDFGCFGSYQESLVHVRQRLLYTTFELETLKMKVNEQMRKYGDQVKQLVDLINIANKERDEARDQLQKLLNKLTPETPVVFPIIPNSSITESNSHNSLNSSPANSFFDAVTSPEISDRINFVGNTHDQRFNLMHKLDSAEAVIESIVKGKVLPEKGKLLEAVMEARPLFERVHVQPVPQWRNPPSLSENFEIPMVLNDQIHGVGPNTWRCGGSQLSSGGAAARRQRLH